MHCKILIMYYKNNKPKRISKMFPDEDFCIYVDYPFDQLVIFFDNITELYKTKYGLLVIDKEYSCTYLWLIQYYEFYYKYFTYSHVHEDFVASISKVLNSTAFESIPKCDFERKKALCNKSNYQLRNIWDESDILILNKKLQVALYVV